MLRNVLEYYLKGKNLVRSILFLLFSIFGIGVLIYSFYCRIEEKAFFERAVPVTVTISKFEVRETKDSEGKVKKVHKVYVDYEHDGVSYEDKYLCDYKSGMKEGDQIEAFCDPENPDQVELYYDVDGHYNEIVIISIFFIICGALPMVLTFFKMRREMR